METTAADPRSKALAIKPRALSLELTKGCNLRCGYCYYAARENAYDPGTAMTPEVAEQSVDRLIKEGEPGAPLHLHFFGGEPLLNLPLLVHTITYAVRRAGESGTRFTFEVTTNGTRFSPEAIEVLNRHRVQVGVSFDGPPDVQDVARPAVAGSSSAQAEPGIRRFLASRKGSDLEGLTHASAVVTRLELDLVRIVRYLEELGFPKVILSPATDLKGQTRGLRPEDLPAILASYDALAQEHEERLRSGRKTLDTWFDGLLAQLHSGTRKTAFCEGGRDYLGVAASGEVYLCYRFYEEPEFQMGSVQEGIDRGVTERLLSSPVDSRPACSRCWARHFCGGGCHHENLITTGGLTEPNAVTCEILRHSMSLTLEMWARLSREQVLPARAMVASDGGRTMASSDLEKGWGDSYRPSRTGSTHARDLDDGKGRKERVLYEPATHEVAVLNPTAAMILDLCDGNRTVAEIGAALAAKFRGAPAEVIEADVRATIADLKSKGFLR